MFGVSARKYIFGMRLACRPPFESEGKEQRLKRRVDGGARADE